MSNNNNMKINLNKEFNVCDVNRNRRLNRNRVVSYFLFANKEENK